MSTSFTPRPDDHTFLSFCLAVRAYMAEEWPTICDRMFNPLGMSDQEIEQLNRHLSSVVYHGFMNSVSVPSCASDIAESFGMELD